MSWWVASLVSNVCIISTEYLNRTSTDGWVEVLPRTMPLIILAQFCIFRTFNGAPHWMLAWVVFAIGNAAMRVVVVQATGQPIGSWPLVLGGMVVMVGGGFILKLGLR